jgi:hypothetical protein
LRVSEIRDEHSNLVTAELRMLAETPADADRFERGARFRSPWSLIVEK